MFFNNRNKQQKRSLPETIRLFIKVPSVRILCSHAITVQRFTKEDKRFKLE